MAHDKVLVAVLAFFCRYRFVDFVFLFAQINLPPDSFLSTFELTIQKCLLKFPIAEVVYT